MLPHIFNGNGTISIMIDGKMKPVDTAHGNYEAIKNAIIACQWDIIPNLINIKEQVESAIQSSATAGKVTIENGEVFYNNKAIHNFHCPAIVLLSPLLQRRKRTGKTKRRCQRIGSKRKINIAHKNK